MAGKPVATKREIDASTAGTPGWYRIQLPQAQPSGRWVSAQCGRGILTATPAPSTPATVSTAGASRCSTPGLAWEALADYCLEHSDELDELAHTGTAWAGYPDDWAAASDELMDELLGVLL